MEGDKVGYPAEICDTKYVSGLSTILVATIEEAKDRISQIEYIFCSQLYPNFQSKSQVMQKIYSEARKAAEDEYKEKENALLLQLEKLREESQENLEKLVSSKDSIIVSKEYALKEVEERNDMLEKKQKNLEVEVERLRFELSKKSKEGNGDMELQNKLLQLVQSKVSSIACKDKQLMEHEHKEKELIAKLENAMKRVDALELQLNEKTCQVESGKVLHGNLLKKIEAKDSEVDQNEQTLAKYEKENRLLKGKVDNDLYRLERSKNVGLIAKVKELEEKVGKLQKNEHECSSSSSDGIELHKQIEAKESELQSEKKKRVDLLTAYKNLKSQYNFLITKLPETKGKHSSHDTEKKIGDNPSISAYGVTKWKDEEKTNTPVTVTVTKRLLGDVKSCPPTTGSKRPASTSYWRDTRSNQSRAGTDLHDDFLDTPLENIRGDMISKAPPHDSDDETQDMNVDPAPQIQPIAEASGFKYIEPVRKKSDRENLKGIDCKQCRKFYDAVLPPNQANNQNLRCEHHDRVSRHRYKYAPPLTPDGFWNIGFESEM